MRVSEGVPKGQFAELYNPEMFQEHEEVIVFTREEFNSFYNSMLDEIEYINRIYLFFDRNQEWKLLGYWPKIMERICILNRNMDLLLTKKPIQTYLDSSIYNLVKNPHKKISAKKKVTGQIKLPI